MEKGEFKRRRDEIFNLSDEKLKELSHTPEDSRLLYKLVESYCRRKKGISNTRKVNTTAASLLWVYSRINFLSENDKKWSRQSLAELFEASSKTVGDKASEIMKALKINYWDDRFAREEVAENSPYLKYGVSPQGFIIPLDVISKKDINSYNMEKEDYYYDGLEHLSEGEFDKAKRCFKKALEIDDEYVDAYNGFGNLYLLKEEHEKSREFYEEAYLLTKGRFSKGWPKRLEWGVLENRQYFRAICGLAFCLWEGNNTQEAKKLFELILKLNPDDNQGVRFVVAAMFKGLNCNAFDEIEERAAQSCDYKELDNLLAEQNKIHGFWGGID